MNFERVKEQLIGLPNVVTANKDGTFTVRIYTPLPDPRDEEVWSAAYNEYQNDGADWVRERINYGIHNNHEAVIHDTAWTDGYVWVTFSVRRPGQKAKYGFKAGPQWESTLIKLDPSAWEIGFHKRRR